MDNYYRFKTLVRLEQAQAEDFLVATYGLSPFQAYTFCVGVPEIDNETLAYTFGCMDEARGLTKVTDQLQ
jgi:hypothetical protein